MKAQILLFFLLALSVAVQAQHFGGFPPATRWQQLHTDTARVIFSGGARAQAERIAGIIHQMAADTPAALGPRLRKINIVLHQNTLLANGYVGLAPFRSEFYLVPSSNIFEFGNLPWHEALAIHEYRHVQQYNNFNNGWTKVFRLLGGEGGQALANALTIPDWFFEGDAVWAETAFTQMGRGRRPLFLSAYNSLWQEGRHYSWMKLRNGSYKDFVPNHYHTGYLLVNYGYQQYGPEFWKKATQRASAFKGLFYPFQKGIQTFSGKDFKTFRKEAFQYYQKGIETNKKTEPAKTVTHFYFPQWAGKDSIIYLKESYRELPAFYLQDKGVEKKVALKSISGDDWLTYSRGKAAYTAYATHPRWSQTDYSDIVVLDISTGKETRLTQKGRYFSPQFSPDGARMIAVFVTESLQTELHLLNSENGNLLKKIRAGDGAYFVHPQFLDEDNLITGVRGADGNMSLQKLNIVDGAAEELVGAGRHTLGYHRVHGNRVYFTASFKGNDDVYAFDVKEKRLYQLTNGLTGHYFPAVQNDTLLFSTYTANGMQLTKQALSEALWLPIELPTINNTAITYNVAQFADDSLRLASRQFEVQPYKKSTGLINIHSWEPSLRLYSNNILNTFSTELYYQFNESENSHTTGWSAAYGGLFPIINAGVEAILNRHVERPGRTLTFNNFEARMGYNIPLNFTKGKTRKGLNFGTNYVVSRVAPTGASKNWVKAENRSYLHHFASWAQLLPQARQHLFPKLGYAVSTAFRHALQQNSYQLNGNANLYLPGLFTNHSFVLTGSFQQIDTGALFFSNRFALARGYDDFYFRRMWNAGANYHLPLLYPDWGFANILYFMRIRSNLYFDYSFVQDRKGIESHALRSTGAEVYFDTKWWNQLPVTFGLRYSYLMDKPFAQGNRNRFELIVPIDLIPL